MKYKKKPVVIDALQYTGTNEDECKLFCTKIHGEYNSHLVIPTLEGPMLVSKGDWIIKGIMGEFYPCKPDIFEKTYELT